MKRKVLIGILMLTWAVMAVSFLSCTNGTNPAGGGSGEISEKYADFYNYPTGRESSTGTLTIKNQVATEVICFKDSVKPENYLCSIPANNQKNVKLTEEKFFTVVSVTKDAYEESAENAVQSSVMTYYSNVQGYVISVSPEDLCGSGKWIISNPTKYWVSLEAVDNSRTYAVIQPEALNVMIPIKTDKNYSYKIVYKKELKFQNRVLAVADMTIRSQNDTAIATSANNYRFSTDIPSNADGNTLIDNLSPAVYFTNSSGKTVQFFNGQILLSNGASVNDEFSIPSGATEMFTGLNAGVNVNGLVVKSVAWDPQACPEDMIMTNGKVYRITLSNNTGADKETKPVLWSVAEENGSNYYEE